MRCKLEVGCRGRVCGERDVCRSPSGGFEFCYSGGGEREFGCALAEVVDVVQVRFGFIEEVSVCSANCSIYFCVVLR